MGAFAAFFRAVDWTEVRQRGPPYADMPLSIHQVPLGGPRGNIRTLETMDSSVTALLSAISLESGPYVNPIKIAVVVVILLVWAMGVQWIDRDIEVVKTRREQWNTIVISGGAVAAFVLLFVPWSRSLFIVGVVFWLLLAGCAMLAYIIHRNSRVVPSAQVLTIGHIKRLVKNREALLMSTSKPFNAATHSCTTTGQLAGSLRSAAINTARRPRPSTFTRAAKVNRHVASRVRKLEHDGAPDTFSAACNECDLTI